MIKTSYPTKKTKSPHYLGCCNEHWITHLTWFNNTFIKFNNFDYPSITLQWNENHVELNRRELDWSRELLETKRSNVRQSHILELKERILKTWDTFKEMGKRHFLIHCPSSRCLMKMKGFCIGTECHQTYGINWEHRF